MMQSTEFAPTPVEGNLVRFDCPFCGSTVQAYTPTLCSKGKRCNTLDCYALFTWPDQLATRWIPSDDDWKVLLK